MTGEHEEIEVDTQIDSLTDQRPLLVLDVDETLLHATETSLERAPDFRVAQYFVYRRPHVQEFLRRCADTFRLAIWSSSGADYLHAALARTVPPEIPLAFVWSRDRCVHRFDAERHEPYFVKDLRKVKRLGFDLARVLIVDDTPKKVERNFGNAVYVSPFVGDPDDAELPELGAYLRTLVEVKDVRQVEKRGWRSRAARR